MRKIFLLLLLSFIIMSNSFAQNANYKTLASFNGDTLSYYKYNFIQNKDSFIGKKVSVLLSSLEVPVKFYIIGDDPANANNAKAFIFSSKDGDDTRTIIELKNDKLYLLTIEFSPTISFLTLINYRKIHGEAITSDQYDYFSQFTITKIVLSAYPR